jgi:hypothetical protein
VHKEFPTVINIVRLVPVRERLVAATIVVVRWFKDLDIICIMFGMICSSYELMK